MGLGDTKTCWYGITADMQEVVCGVRLCVREEESNALLSSHWKEFITAWAHSISHNCAIWPDFWRNFFLSHFDNKKVSDIYNNDLSNTIQVINTFTYWKTKYNWSLLSYWYWVCSNDLCFNRDYSYILLINTINIV